MSGSDFHYVVKGRGPFPLDMLRYDEAHPLSEDDRRTVQALSGEFCPDVATLREVVTIRLVMRGAGRRRPHTARWESFGWSVPGDEARLLAKAMNGEDARLEALSRSAMSKLTDEEKEAVRWATLREVV